MVFDHASASQARRCFLGFKSANFCDPKSPIALRWPRSDNDLSMASEKVTFLKYCFRVLIVTSDSPASIVPCVIPLGGEAG